MKIYLTKQSFLMFLPLLFFTILLTIISSCSKINNDLENLEVNPKPYNKEQVVAFSKTLRDGTRFLAALRLHKTKANAKLLPIDEQRFEDSLFANNDDEFRIAYLAQKESEPVKNFQAGIEAWTDSDGEVNGIENYEVIDQYFQAYDMNSNIRGVMHDLIAAYNQVTDDYEAEVDETGNGDIDEFANRLQEATRNIEEQVINRDDISYSDKEIIFTITTYQIENIPFIVHDTKESIAHFLANPNGRTFFGKLWRAAANVVVVAVIAVGLAAIMGNSCPPCAVSTIGGCLWQMGKMVFGNNYLFGCKKVRRCNSSGTNCFMACEIW